MTKDEAVSLFEYKDGDLYWKKSRQRAGSTNSEGYRSTRFNGKYLLNHRIVFLMHHGFIPKLIDHIDGDKSNNRIDNLRECTQSQNQMNRKPSGVLGIKNVSYHSRDKKFVVKIRSGKTIFRGQYDDLELAELVAREACVKYHGEFAKGELSST